MSLESKKLGKLLEINPRLSSFTGLKEAYGELMTDLISDIYLGKRF